jgi:hypothetical protein
MTVRSSPVAAVVAVRFRRNVTSSTNHTPVRALAKPLLTSSLSQVLEILSLQAFDHLGRDVVVSLSSKEDFYFLVRL